MGSTGARTTVGVRRIAPPPQPQPSQQQNIAGSALPPNNGPQVANQTPNAQNTPVSSNALANFSSLSDAQMAAVINQAKQATLPNFLSDRHDITQQVVYALGLNDKPLVLDDTAFNKFLSDNNISRSDILARSQNSANYTNAGNANVKFTAQQLFDIHKYSRLNYIGGKQGGQAYGAGTYLDRTGGNSRTGYGSVSNDAVLNPKYARVIDASTLRSRAATFAQSHPQFVRAVGQYGYGGNQSVYALAMGYNVIRGGSYHNVIDRRALVWKKDTY